MSGIKQTAMGGILCMHLFCKCLKVNVLPSKLRSAKAKSSDLDFLYKTGSIFYTRNRIYVSMEDEKRGVLLYVNYRNNFLSFYLETEHCFPLS